MNTIPTVEEYFRKRYEELKTAPPEDFNGTDVLIVKEIIKLHVEAALKAAAERAEAIEGWNTGFSGSAASVNKDSILNAYPLTNII